MVRYFTGINSTSFDKGYNPNTRVFDKSKILGIDKPNRIYLIKNPIVIDLVEGFNILLKRKTSARFARELAKFHGGIPLILECDPDFDLLEKDDDGINYWCQKSPEIKVNGIYGVRGWCSFGDIDFAVRLVRMNNKNYLEKFVLQETVV